MKRFLAVGFACLAMAQETPQQATHHFQTPPGLEVTLWAAEPMLENPTNIDIDERGRIWVLEGVNYRRQLKHLKDYRPNGDRILILEDAGGEGRATKVKIFDQNPSLRSPLGIAVLGNKVIVSQSPDVIVYTKDDQDRIVKKEVLLTGWRGVDHDHGVHKVIFGPDGRYYLNNGDPGFDITDKSGKRFVSARSGPYYAGCALRVDPDGTNFTVVAHDFRNPYELAVDSFGSIWQSDNDDDGNAWTRLTYVMEGGNYGYWGPGGRRWQEDKGTHFHNELPGVVPNIARLGAGAPCGIVAYEGQLLPRKYWGQLIHAEAGKRVINTYSIATDGAGYSETTEQTVTSVDSWFRPSDVVVAPDGSIFFSDWYDPVVGGHEMKDIARGRIYKLAPRGAKPLRPLVDLESPEGLRTAFRSPAQSVRYLAWMKLRQQGQAALPALLAMWKQDDPILKARALWLLGALGGEGAAAIDEALHSSDPNFRILAIRVLRRYGADMQQATYPLLHDPSPAVRREIAIALQDSVTSDGVNQSIAELARQYDGRDRWYLEALGIAARGRENAIYARLRDGSKDTWSPNLGQLLWEFRPPDALPYLISRVRDKRISHKERTEALNALAAMPGDDAGTVVAQIVVSDGPLAEKAFEHLSHQLFSEWIGLRKSPDVQTAIRYAFHSPSLEGQAVELADDLGDPAYGPELLAVARSPVSSEPLRVTAIEALGRTREQAYARDLERLYRAGPVAVRMAAVRAAGDVAPPGLDAAFERLILSDEPNEVRSAAVKVLARSRTGANLLLDLQEQGKLPAEMKNIATSSLNSSRDQQIRKRASALLPPLTASGKKQLPPIETLVWQPADAERGRKVFNAENGPKCSGCHSVGGKKKVGPDLAGIGTKLGKDGLFDSILHPSAGIAPEYYMWILETSTQGEVIGIVPEDTPQRVVVKTDATTEVRLKPSEIRSRRRSHLSLMPEDLMNYMTEQQLVDVVAYLATLKDQTRASR